MLVILSLTQPVREPVYLLHKQGEVTLASSLQQKHRKTKLMLTLNPDTLKALDEAAHRRGITVQELLRAIIIPQWLKENLD